MYVWDQGAYGKSLYRPLNFAVNLKLLLIKSLFRKKKGIEVNLEIPFNILNIYALLVKNYLRDVFIYKKNDITYHVYINKILKTSQRLH